MTGELLKSSGDITIDSLDIISNIESIRKKIGYCPQHMSILELLSASEHMDMYSKIKKVHQS